MRAIKLAVMLLVIVFGFAASRTIGRFGLTNKFAESICKGTSDLVDKIGQSLAA